MIRGANALNGAILESTGQPKITGYRELSVEEVALMNEIKAAGQQIDALCHKVFAHLRKHILEELRGGDARGWDTSDGLSPFSDTPFKWLGRGRTDLQVGLMKLTRAVAQPTSF